MVCTSCIYQLFRIDLIQKILHVAITTIRYKRLLLLGTKMTSLLQIVFHHSNLCTDVHVNSIKSKLTKSSSNVIYLRNLLPYLRE